MTPKTGEGGENRIMQNTVQRNVFFDLGVICFRFFTKITL